MTKSWWSLHGRQPATADVDYKLADEKPSYLQQVEQPSVPSCSCAKRITDAAAATRAAVGAAITTKLRCFRSLWWAIPLTFATAALSIAWFVMRLIVDTDTVRVQYGLAPLPTTAYTAYGIVTLVIVPVLTIVLFCVLCTLSSRAVRRILVTVSAVYVVLLVVGNVLSIAHTHERHASEPIFAVQFNTRYCSAYTLRACLNKTSPQQQQHVLALAGIDNTPATLNATAAANAVCIDTIRTLSTLQLLVNREPLSDSVATWCSRFATHERIDTPLVAADHTTQPAPYAAHTELFVTYCDEWSRRMLLTNALLGSTVVCALLATVAWTLEQTTKQY